MLPLSRGFLPLKVILVTYNDIPSYCNDKLKEMLVLYGKIDAMEDKIGDISEIKDIEAGYIYLERYVKDVSKGYLGPRMKEDLEYLCSSMSKIRFKLAAFYVSLSPSEEDQINFVIPELVPSSNYLAMVNKSFSNPLNLKKEAYKL